MRIHVFIAFACVCFSATAAQTKDSSLNSVAFEKDNCIKKLLRAPVSSGRAPIVRGSTPSSRASSVFKYAVGPDSSNPLYNLTTKYAAQTASLVTKKLVPNASPDREKFKRVLRSAIHESKKRNGNLNIVDKMDYKGSIRISIDLPGVNANAPVIRLAPGQVINDKSKSFEVPRVEIEISATEIIVIRAVGQATQSGGNIVVSDAASHGNWIIIQAENKNALVLDFGIFKADLYVGPTASPEDQEMLKIAQVLAQAFNPTSNQLFIKSRNASMVWHNDRWETFNDV